MELKLIDTGFALAGGQREGVKACVVVAHPDDCIIFARNFIEWQAQIGWTIVYLTHSRTTIRGAEVANFWRRRGIRTEFLEFEDLPENTSKKSNNIEPAEVLTKLKAVLGSAYAFILTHNANGEYGHPHHKLLHATALEIPLPKVYFGHFTKYPTLELRNSAGFSMAEIPRNLTAVVSFANRYDVLKLSSYICEPEVAKYLQEFPTRPIPRVLHFVYLNNIAMPQSIAANIDNWRGLHPEFEIVVWTEAELLKLELDGEFANFASALRMCRPFAMKSDIARLALIYKFGGVYCDLKNSANRRFLEDLRKLGQLVVSEHPRTIEFEHRMVCNAFLASPPRNPIVARVLERVLRNVLSQRTDGGVTAITGSGPLRHELTLAHEDYTTLDQDAAWSQVDMSGMMRRISSPELNGQRMELHWTKISANDFYDQRASVLKDIFTRIYTTNGWGNSETVSGSASTATATRYVREELQLLLSRYEIRSVFDAGCGDFNWMRLMDWTGISYTGGEIVSDLVAKNKETYPGMQFIESDMTQDTIPSVDLIICRNCLNHLPTAEVWATLRNFAASGARYLLMTSQTWNRFENGDSALGKFRRLNFFIAPFSFPPPLQIIVEGNLERQGAEADRSLCLWRLDDLRSVLDNQSA